MDWTSNTTNLLIPNKFIYVLTHCVVLEVQPILVTMGSEYQTYGFLVVGKAKLILFLDLYMSLKPLKNFQTLFKISKTKTKTRIYHLCFKIIKTGLFFRWDICTDAGTTTEGVDCCFAQVNYKLLSQLSSLNIMTNTCVAYTVFRFLNWQF